MTTYIVTNGTTVLGSDSVQGTAGTADTVTLLGAGGTLNVSAIDSVIGTAGSSDAVALLGTGAGTVSVSAIESVLGRSGETEYILDNLCSSGPNSPSSHHE